MSALARLREQRESGLAVQGVVGTMKSFAVVQLHRWRRLEESLAAFVQGAESVLVDLLRHLPEDEPATEPQGGALIVLGSDRGLAGHFGETVLQAAMRQKERHGDPIGTLALGKRLESPLRRAGFSPLEVRSMPGTASSAESCVTALVEDASSWVRSGAGAVRIAFAGRDESGAIRGETCTLFPPDPAWLSSLRSRARGDHGTVMLSGTREDVRNAAVELHLTARLARALAESLSCENLLRLSAMQQAEKHVEEYLEELRLQFNQERQSDITAELLDITGGVEALARRR